MTIHELLNRIRATSVVEVLTTIANDAAAARDFTLSLGPHLLGPFLRDELRKQGIVALSSGGRLPAPRHDWSRLDWQRWTDWIARGEIGLRGAKRFGHRVVKAFGKDLKLPYAKLRERLGEEDVQKLDKLCGKVLSA